MPDPEPPPDVRSGPSSAAVIAQEAAPKATQGWDVRLVPAAALGWLIAWAAPPWPVEVLLLVAGVALAAAAWTLRRGTLERRARSGAHATAAIALALAGLGLVAGTSAGQVSARDSSPLRHLAVDGQDVRVRLRVTDSIRVLASAAIGPRVLVPASAESLTCQRPCLGSSIRSWTLTGEVLVFAPEQGWAQLSPGTTVSATVTLAEAAPEDLLVGVAFARGPPKAVMAPHGNLEAAAAGIRGGLREGVGRVLGPDEAGLLRGIVLGDTAGMDPILVEDFRISGLSHLTAVSGTNCAIVIGAVLWPLRRSRLRGLLRALLAALALAGFVALVGPQPSVLRAAAMGAITLLALATGRARQALPALAATVIVLLGLDPALARDLGFALSVAATAGIVVVAGPWSERLRTRGWPEPLAVATAVCAAAGLCTAPLLVLIAARVSLISLPANLLVVPVVAIVTVLGLTAALVAPVWPWLSEVFLRLADWPLRWMVWIAERAARTPGAVLPWPGGLPGALALTAALVVSVMLLRRRRVRWLVAAACVGLLASGLSVRVLAPAWPPPGWQLVACDVGQGDAMVVALGSSRALVIDAGPDPVLVDGCLRRLGVQHVPLLVLSHLHADHVAGLTGVLRGRTIGVVATSLDPPSAEAYHRIRRVTEDAGVPLRILTPGQTQVVETATIEVLAPVVRYVGTRSDPNNSSIVARIAVGGISMLATGDVELEAQSDLLRRRTDLTADVLKVAHHGSAYQDPAFLLATQARVALISVGAGNDYGHPDEVLVDRLRGAGMAVHRTDEGGDIAVLDSAGSGLTVVSRGDPLGTHPAETSSLPTGDLPVDRIIRWSGPRRVALPRRARWRDRGSGRRPDPRLASRRKADRPVRPRGSRHHRPRLPVQRRGAARSRGGSAGRPPVRSRSARPRIDSRCPAPTAR